MPLRRAAAVVVAVLVLAAIPVLASPLSALPAARAQPLCPNAVAPGPPVDTSEVPRPGATVPPPLPRPATPVGGPAMGVCGDVVLRGSPPPPPVAVESYVVADLDSGAVLAARNPHARLRPASLMKTLTGLLVARRLDMTAPVVGTPEDANQEGTRVGIGPGGQYTVGQLLQAMMMASGNDAAHALSVKLTGSVEGTVALMNDTARGLGALDTRTATPSGLDGPGMQTSAYDLASIFRVGMREPEFARATGTRAITLPGYNGLPPVPVSNDNKLFGTYPGAIGGKTGFTDDARHTYIGAAERDGRRLVVVLMRGEQRPVPLVRQGAALLDYGFARARGPGIGTLTDASLPGAGGSGASGDGGRAASSGLPPVVADDDGPSSPGWTIGLAVAAAAALALLVVGVRYRDRR